MKQPRSSKTLTGITRLKILTSSLNSLFLPLFVGNTFYLSLFSCVFCFQTRRHQQEQEIEAAILIQHQYRRYKEVCGVSLKLQARENVTALSAETEGKRVTGDKRGKKRSNLLQTRENT